MVEVNVFLKNFLKGKKNKAGYYTARLQLQWQQLVGEYIAQKSFPGTLKDDVLFLEVVSAGWAHNFLMLKEEIINKINSGFSDIIVRDIRFNIKGKLGKIEVEQEKTEELILPELDENEHTIINNIVKAVNDENLAKSLKRIITKDKSRKKYFLHHDYPVCGDCGVELSYYGQYCCACEKNMQIKTEQKLVQTFFQLPWLTFEQINQTMPVKYKLFRQIKARCEQLFFENATKKQASRSDVQRYVMLVTGMSAFELTEEIVEQTMKKVWRVKHVPSFRSGYND